MTSPPPRRAALIINAKSRKGRRLFREACRLIRAAGIELDRADAVRNPRRFADHVRDAIVAGSPLVIVGGGDGSISSSVDHFVGTETILALLPLGTANSFARTLGIPLDLPGAVEVIADGATRTIDLGMIDAHHFANCATIGIAPQIAQTVPHGLKAWLGRPGYLLWAAYQLVRFRGFLLTIGEGETAETMRAVEVRIANGPYHGGVDLVEQARLDSGRIVVQVVTGETRRSLVWSWTSSVLRLPARARTMRDYNGEAIRIATVPPLPISIDGELLARTPATARIARRAIRVVAPRA